MTYEDIRYSPTGWWIPESDISIELHMHTKNCKYKERYMWQYSLMKLCMYYIPLKKRELAIDIGSHVGLWTFFLADVFEYIHCFEPLEIHRECWIRNTKDLINTRLYPFALGNRTQKVNMLLPKEASVAAHIKDRGLETSYSTNVEYGDIEVVSLDSFCLDVPPNTTKSKIDFIKIDVQGYELKVVGGALDTIKKNKPWVLVEDQETGTPTVKLLASLGMKKFKKFKGDYLMGWKNDK